MPQPPNPPLIVHLDPATRAERLLGGLRQCTGGKLCLCDNPATLLQALRQRRPARPPVAVLITAGEEDSGYRALAQIHQDARLSASVVVVVSTTDRLDERRLVLAEGAHGYHAVRAHDAERIRAVAEEWLSRPAGADDTLPALKSG